MSMREAVERFVPDGSSVAMGTSLEALIPFAAGHELIRARRRGLTLIGPISDALFDQLIGAGCVERIVAAWVGNVSEGLGHCYRRAVESAQPHAIEVFDHTNFSISLALWAAAWNAPYLPTITLLGSDILTENPHLRQRDGLVEVEAVKPDVAIVHVQRCDARGRAHAWGPLGVTEEAVLAARAVVISCEELVDEEVTLSDPNRVLVAETKVAAVVHEPGGAHPSGVPGFWQRDHAHFRDYAERSRTAEGFDSWLREWVVDVRHRNQYLQRVDTAKLRVSRHLFSAPVDYGFE